MAFGMILRAVPGRSRWQWPVRLRQDVAGVGMMAVISLGIGLAINGLSRQPLPLVYVSPRARLEATVAQMPPDPRPPVAAPEVAQSIGLDEFQALVSAHEGLSIDARPGTVYATGHVSGAVNLPREDFARGYAAIRARIEPAKERPIVVYCSEADCQDAALVAGALRRLGYRRLFVYKAGWEEWQRAGLPQETGYPL